jgi:hypothetical protein
MMCHAHNQNKKSVLNSNVHTNTQLPDPSQLVINFVIIVQSSSAARRGFSPHPDPSRKFLNNPPLVRKVHFPDFRFWVEKLADVTFFEIFYNISD